jgi:hypothetical protein
MSSEDIKILGLNEFKISLKLSSKFKHCVQTPICFKFSNKLLNMEKPPGEIFIGGM